MKTLSILLIVAAAPAFAADLPSRAAPPVYVPPLVPLTWTGCYAGGFGALDIAHVENDPADSRSTRLQNTSNNSTRATTSATTPLGTTVSAPRPFTRQGNQGAGFIRVGNAFTRTTRTRTVTTTAVTNTTRVTVVNAAGQNRTAYGRTIVGGDGGGRIGCNYQSGRFVVGAQLEGGYLGVNGTTFSPARRSTASAIGGGVFGAVTGRVGYAVFDRTLVYARGGVGYADLTFSTFDPVLGYYNATRGSRVMPLVGAGIEYKLTPRISVTGEYTYLRPGCRTVGYVFAAANGGGTSTTCVEKHMIALGLNYYFTPDAATVVARY